MISDKPLEYWSKRQSQSGRIRKILDSDLLENVIEIQDFEQPHGYGTSILCPSDTSQFLNIELPILVVVIKNVNLHCRLQVQVVDTQNCLHNFQFTNAESEKHNSRGVICRARIKLENGWNKLELNLSNLTQTAFKRQYAYTQRLQICGNCRLRRVYFIDRHYEQQEICPELYHGFLDSYMLKWGIHAVERSTQTNGKRTKSKVKGNNNSKGVSKACCSVENLSGDEIGYSAATDRVGRKLIDENFLRNLQIKTDMLINEFFERQAAKLPQASELKQNAKLKPYAFPLIVASKFRSSNNAGISEETLKRINVLRTFTDTYISEEKRIEEDAVKAIQENWRHRYYVPQEESRNAGDPSKSNAKRTMLERKPKSMLVLSEMKPAVGRGKVSNSIKKNMETTKLNESDAIVG